MCCRTITYMHSLFEILAASKSSHEKKSMNRLIDSGELFLDKFQNLTKFSPRLSIKIKATDLVHHGIKNFSAQQIPRNRKLAVYQSNRWIVWVIWIKACKVERILCMSLSRHKNPFSTFTNHHRECRYNLIYLFH